MSIFPEEFDPRADVVIVLSLVLVDTPDGAFGFMPGIEGRFVDTTGRIWWGSQLISVGDLQFALNGSAPTGNLSLSFFQDPDAPNLVAEVRALGADYVAGREIIFFEQYLNDHAEFYAPLWGPTEILRRRMRKVTVSAEGPQQREISVSFEGPFENRRTARRRVYNSEDHSALVGASNPSLNFIPRDVNFKEKLFG
jgi:hypothetical protein